MRSTSSGIPALDDLLAGLLPGDNVVWVTAGHTQVAAIERSFLMEGLRRGEPCSYVTTELSPNRLRSDFGGDLRILDARPGRSLADATALESRILDDAREEPGRIVVDSLDAFVRRLDRPRALGLFSRVCPQLYDLGAIAYWRVSRASAGARLIEGITKVTQCVLELGVSHLRVIKAESRPGAEGRLLHLRADSGDTPSFEQEKALGRLGTGLRRIREERRLSQADLARLAGVSPSAISQAEAGHRGLALETLLTLVEALGVGLDDLLHVRTSGDYVLARRDRLGPPQGHVALLDDDSAGLRAYLIQLSPGQRGTPPVPHKGVELILVASGLVQADLGTATPVLRAGDAVLATRASVAGWRNLLGEPARLFWIIRD
ncbi:MAG TPA: helix-turn-helix domain-containing protein [Acidimicrobiia bacterium]|nr:helix-turn-helix domain-containing protein [Acidimicrobiia bacterium]